MPTNCYINCYLYIRNIGHVKIYHQCNIVYKWINVISLRIDLDSHYGKIHRSLTIAFVNLSTISFLTLHLFIATKRLFSFNIIYLYYIQVFKWRTKYLDLINFVILVYLIVSWYEFQKWATQHVRKRCLVWIYSWR